MRFPSEVLPVVSIVTLSFIVLLVERTPFSLKVEHIEISVLLHKMDYPCLNVSHRVGEGAVLTIFTVCQVLRKFSAKLGFIFFNMIQSFYSIVSQRA
jgi:hypothetical protein